MQSDGNTENFENATKVTPAALARIKTIISKLSTARSRGVKPVSDSQQIQYAQLMYQMYKSTEKSYESYELIAENLNALKERYKNPEDENEGSNTSIPPISSPSSNISDLEYPDERYKQGDIPKLEQTLKQMSGPRDISMARKVLQTALDLVDDSVELTFEGHSILAGDMKWLLDNNQGSENQDSDVQNNESQKRGEAPLIEYSDVNNNDLFESEVSKLVENDPKLGKRLNQLLGGGNDFMNKYLSSLSTKIQEGEPLPSLSDLLNGMSSFADELALQEAGGELGVSSTKTQESEPAVKQTLSQFLPNGVKKIISQVSNVSEPLGSLLNLPKLVEALRNILSKDSNGNANKARYQQTAVNENRGVYFSQNPSEDKIYTKVSRVYDLNKLLDILPSLPLNEEQIQSIVKFMEKQEGEALSKFNVLLDDSRDDNPLVSEIKDMVQDHYLEGREIVVGDERVVDAVAEAKNTLSLYSDSAEDFANDNNHLLPSVKNSATSAVSQLQKSSASENEDARHKDENINQNPDQSGPSGPSGP
ncbi:MAG: hypothetical protein VXW87_04945 [Pseudomonadota bacterium]|nr:hypothetical protein [Pseudomonadota bacterium]